MLSASGTDFGNMRAGRCLTGRLGQFVLQEHAFETLGHCEAQSVAEDYCDRCLRLTDAQGFTTTSYGLESREPTNLMDEILTPRAKVIRRHFEAIAAYSADCSAAVRVCAGTALFPQFKNRQIRKIGHGWNRPGALRVGHLCIEAS